jgi:phospholipase A1
MTVLTDRGVAWRGGTVLIGSLLLAFAAAAADPGPAWSDCRSKTDEAERLRCYDALPEDLSLPAAPPTDEVKPALEQRIEKERDLARRAFAILPHRPNYLLTTYTSEPNVAPFLTVDPNANLEHNEIKFQISLLVPVWNRIYRNNGDLWFAYTQQSFWQAYNWAGSAPFRETNYEPEFGLSFHTDFPVFGLRHRLVSFGFAHQSNGRSEPLSRSWNRIWASFELVRGNLAVSLKPWYRIPENASVDENPDIQEYVGRAELRTSYKYRDHVFSFILRNNLRVEDNRSGYELDWSLPFSKRIKALVQYYNGYGESLIDYNVRSTRIGVGMVIDDWL